MSEKCSEEAMC